MKYDAFISYRHAELDMEIAKKVHAGLESFKVPPSVQKRATKKRIRRVFRDQEELPIGSDLGENIATALYNSDFLVVICSPRTMGSEWVMKEIDTFISMHGREHILAVLIEGEPEQSFPPQLRIDDMGRAVEPLAADVRGANRRERNEKLKSELIRLAAPILGCNYDDLRQRHRERKLRKTMGIVAAVTGGIALAAAAFGVYSTIVANQMKNLADEKSKLAEKMTVIASQKSEYADQVQYNMDQKNQNQSRYLVAMADTLFRNGNREDAVLVTLEALPTPGSLASDYYDEDEDDDDDWDDEED
ncbi:MAG: toll/interleukin-1 receptor domain-containing protein, partial [Lachnospiraceae bacterium]|nr:toll/interleukin-1 receptor domain-containing protein [Lachnospiraceae bacterium]